MDVPSAMTQSVRQEHGTSRISSKSGSSMRCTEGSSQYSLLPASSRLHCSFFHFYRRRRTASRGFWLLKMSSPHARCEREAVPAYASEILPPCRYHHTPSVYRSCLTCFCGWEKGD